ncbi:polysaccharide biosynthesis protein [Pontibacillus yanchengensis]|uniref:Polysaccharide biosynthesis protein EpsC n=1 Tax=Pontibacillus yanchengensis Y32 TaxID=1385514 RepID=A0A0A2TKE7_9BACI|nr:nucleoside-diphosphate sugar epimerase/dehydratase [Pontibacillus yanchengensis]KGP74561.1 polysaccharide biosynthesis protein EpsC [Pontibacillus yanchengensis Y32]
MSFSKRLALLIFIDSMIVSFSIYMSHFFLNPYYAIFDNTILMSSIILLVCHHLFSWLLGMYRKVWRYASMEELVGIIIVVTSSIAITAVIQLITIGAIYERALTVTWMLHILLIGGVRFAWRYYKTYGVTFRPKGKRVNVIKNNENIQRTLIVGAGSAGQMLARQMKNNKEEHSQLIGFVDDDETMHGLSISGIPVLGGAHQLSSIAEARNIDHIVIAMPSVELHRRKEVIQQAQAVVKNVQTLPMIEDIAMGNVSTSQVRDVSIEDLLGREPVELDMESISSEINGKTVLVTGAGGSIGSEICRQIVKFKPYRLVLLGHGENSIYTIHMELSKLDLDISIVPVIADVQDRERMFDVVREFSPSYIYHAAAHKHVPLMEANPKEAVKNNVMGTKNIAEAASTFGVRNFVLISSDKAVNPPNVMGASKRIAEMIIQSLNGVSDTNFVAVRFGNVLGSRGSVIPLFKKQIESGGPVTVTHPEMTRYFMTIPEASRLVLQAGALARGGEIFVLDMGESVKIVDLARNLIHLSGFTEDDISIEFAGVRPGEKLYEELLNNNEVYDKPIFPKIFIGKPVEIKDEYVEYLIDHHESFQLDQLRYYVLSLANNETMDNFSYAK